MTDGEADRRHAMRAALLSLAMTVESEDGRSTRSESSGDAFDEIAYALPRGRAHVVRWTTDATPSCLIVSFDEDLVARIRLKGATPRDGKSPRTVLEALVRRLAEPVGDRAAFEALATAIAAEQRGGPAGLADRITIHGGTPWSDPVLLAHRGRGPGRPIRRRDVRADLALLDRRLAIDASRGRQVGRPTIEIVLACTSVSLRRSSIEPIERLRMARRLADAREAAR